MSTQPSTGTPARFLVRGAERDTVLGDLVSALVALGDDASRATQTSRDVRLHVISCHAEHLAGEVRDLMTDSAFDGPFVEAGGLVASATAAREALEKTAEGPLPESIAASVRWLIDLTEAVTT
ncbi:hypothetical protein [Knoellia aerolata]|uniref:Uncharacterized protein n=1 Tax=Knoellia aerolata DSM 18566 TaxID=1385519 RepID=A0A0A0JTE0_9MICO|nr:hypothetical protein [Knoellia aerolata]KGN39949.1 hypothetical protein N801_17740 [Knoellia aerolata DSM 18566]